MLIAWGHDRVQVCSTSENKNHIIWRKNMKKKIAIYTICRNEEKHVLQWLENTRDADVIIVGDTGSNDNTVALLKENGAIVFDIRISPWRFDEARNQILNLIPEDVDICISLDFDERLSADWRRNIENAWQKGVTRLSYEYTNINQQNSNWNVTIRTSKIHSRRDYKWVYPVHELLAYCGQRLEREVYVNGLTITHTPDPSKDRGGYFKLMELAAEENPSDVRILHHLGREYMQNGQFDKCIEIMRRTEKLPGITLEQKHACMRFIARAYGEKNDYNKAKGYLLKIIDEAPYCSAAYIEHVILSYKYQEWDDIVSLSSKFNEINFQEITFYNEFFSSEGLLYDLTSIAFYHKLDYENALAFAEKGLEKSQDKIRLNKNIELYKEKLLG
jgi:tetratricopeptide (TPR) repeat protein